MGQAQERLPENAPTPHRENRPSGGVPLLLPLIPVQGRLTDASGTPLNGTYTITASLYDVDTGGTPRCTSTPVTAQVTNGLFNMTIGNPGFLGHCNASNINGDFLYLGIKVGSDPEMTPRQIIWPVPYAYSLVPNAVLGGDLKQAATANGVIKAGVSADCGKTSSIYRSFTNVPGASTITISGGTTGLCLIDFGFDVHDRYVVVSRDATHNSSPQFVTFSLCPSACPFVEVRVYNSAGAPDNGAITVLVY